jgi:DNA-binding MarR family transcriptional regulator
VSSISRHPGPQPEDPSIAIDRALAPLLMLAARASAEAVQRVSSSQLQALLCLHEQGPLKLTKLAEALEVIPSSATRLCDRLVAADLITRKTGTVDRREVVLQLTTSGKKLIRQIQDRRQAEIRQALTGMSDRERRGLLAGLEALAAQLTHDEGTDAAPGAAHA